MPRTQSADPFRSFAAALQARQGRALDKAREEPRLGLQRAISTLNDERARLETLPMDCGKFTVVIAARNEESCIPDTLTRVVQGLPPRGEALLVLNACTDGTADAVRTWAQAQPGVSLLERDGAGRVGLPRPGTTPVTLLEEQPGGKLRALNVAGDYLVSRGVLPEYVMQLDADTQLRPGTLEALAKRAAEGYGAVGAKIHMVPDVPGRPLGLVGEYLNVMHGGPRGQVCGGFATLSRAPLFIAGHQAAYTHFRQVANEDLLYTALLRLAGHSTVVASVPLDTRGETDPERTKAQYARWTRGSLQVASLPGEALREVGLGACDRDTWTALTNAFEFASAYLGAAHSPREALERSQRLVAAGREALGYLAIARTLRQEARDAAVEYEWVPERDAGSR